MPPDSAWTLARNQILTYLLTYKHGHTGLKFELCNALSTVNENVWVI